MIYLAGALGDIQQFQQIQNTLSGIIYAFNLTVQSVENVRQSLGQDINLTALDAARTQITQLTNDLQTMRDHLNQRTQPPPQPDWNRNQVEVFTNTGADRFRREVADADRMLERLGNTQSELVRRMWHNPGFSQEAVDDISSLASRIDRVRERMRQIEENPLNLHSDAANEQLEKLRTQFNAATKAQEELDKASQNMDMGAANDACLRLQQIISDTERQIRDNADEDGRIRSKGGDKKNGFISSVASGAKEIFSMENARRVMELSDQMVETKARLGLLVDDGGSVQELQDKIYASAQNARMAYQTTASAVAALGVQAGEAFGSNDEIILFTELLNKQLTSAGVSASDAGSVMEKVTEAMASGSVKEDALEDILNTVPGVAENLQTYFEDALHIDAGNLEGLASKGMITAEVLKNALFYSADGINEKFESMPRTWGQAWQSFKDTALHIFTPVLEWVNGVVNSDSFQTVVDGITGAMQVLSVVIQGILDLAGMVGALLVDNWSVVEPLVWGMIAALIVYNAVMGIAWLTALKNAAIKVVDTTVSAAQAVATFVMTAAQSGLNAAMTACPITWIIIGFIAFIAVIIAVCSAIAKFTGVAGSAFGVICGVVAAVGAFIWNVFIGLINAVMQGIWNIFVLPFITIIEWVLNVANGGFNSFGDAVASLIGEIISWFLSLGMVVTKIIDAIFGTNWTQGLSELQGKVLSWGKNENAITLDRTAPAAGQRLEYGDAFGAGARWGDGVSDMVGGFFDGLFGGDGLPGVDDLPNPEDYAGLQENALENTGVAGGVGDIATNTGEMADAMTVTQEDLKYLRDIAEQEAINRFTTAEITVDMSGMQNTLNNNGDLDGFISRMTAAVCEAVDSMTEGVHA